MPSRSNAFAPPPSSGQTGIMPDLYRLSVGPVNAAYYQQQFNRFEALGKVTPTWNHGAAFFTLAWLLLRKLWRPAGIYAGLLAALLLLWWGGLHGRVPLQLEATVCLLATLLMCAIPGFMGNGLYYQHVRSQTLKTLTRASSIGQARAQLSQQSVTKERFQVVATIQTLAVLALAAFLFYTATASPLANASPAPSGPPDLVIPAVGSVTALEPTAFAPEVALPALPESAPVAQEAPLQDNELSIVALAQSIPAATEADAPKPTTSPAAPVAAMKAPAAPEPVAAPPAKKAATPPAAAQPKPQPPQKPTAKPAAAGQLIAGKYYLNAGVYAQTANVDKAVKSLQAAKLNALRQTVSSNKGELTRLRIGPFDTRQQAEQAAVKAQQLRIETRVFQQPKP